MVKKPEVGCDDEGLDEMPTATRCPQLRRPGLMEPLYCPLATMNIWCTLPCWKTQLLCCLLGELCDGTLAVGLDDGVGEAVLHDETFGKLSLVFRWPFLGRDDCAAEAGDCLCHREDGDVLGLLLQRRHPRMWVVHEAVVQLDCAMLMLMSTILSTTDRGLNTDGAPVAMWHMSKVALSYFSWTWR